MIDFWTTLLVAAVPAGAAHGGVGLSNRNNRVRQHELVREEALNRQRELVLSILDSGRAWAGVQDVVLPMISRFSVDDMIEFVNTDSGQHLAKTVADLRSHLARANLFLASAELRQLTASVSAFVNRFPDDINGPIVARPGSIEPVLTGIREVARFTKFLDQLESRSSELLRSPILSE